MMDPEQVGLVSNNRNDLPCKPELNADKSEVAYSPASTLDQVTNAWNLVYARYVEIRLVDPNPYQIHTMPEAAGPTTCVICGHFNDEVVATLTAISDTSHGLPLDSVYPDQLAQMRASGRRLTEIGLLAERKENMAQSASALFELMKWSYYYSLHSGSTDMVIGVHPRHVKFYQRCLAFEPFGPPSIYPTVKNNPVVPMRLMMAEKLRCNPLPRGIKYWVNHPVDPDAFDNRFMFSQTDLQDSRVQTYLRERSNAYSLV